MKNTSLFEFFVEGGDREQSHVLLHITEPATRQEHMRGYFFALAEIEHGDHKLIEQVQAIIDNLESHYYDVKNSGGAKDPFEEVLEYVNRNAGELLDQDAEIHIIVGVVRDGDILFSYHGQPHALLMYRKGDRLKTLDVLPDEQEDEDALFSELVRGQLKKGDFFFVATPFVTQYFSYDRLVKLLSARAPRDVTRHVQKVLVDIGSDNSFGGIVFHQEDMPPTGKRTQQAGAVGSEESLNQFIEAKRRTAETLSPPLFGGLSFKKDQDDKKRKKRKQSSSPETHEAVTPKNESNYRPRPKAAPAANSALVHTGRGIVFVGTMIWNGLKTLGLLFWRFIIVCVILVTNKNNGRRAILHSLRDRVRRSKTFVVQLPLISKILFVATLLLATIFVSSIATFKMRENRNAQKQAYEQAIQAVEDKQSAAEAALIYNDNEKAGNLLHEAQELLKELDSEKKGVEQRATLAEAITDSLMKLRKMNAVEATLLADLSASNQDSKATRLALVGDTLIAYGPQDEKLSIVHKNTGTVTSVSTGPLKGLRSHTTPKENDMVVFLGENNSVAQYDPTSQTLSLKDIAYPNGDHTIEDIFVYNLRLYSLAPATNQIYKHNKTQTGYDRGAPWVQDNTSLEGGAALAIDGDIFAITKSGGITAFEKGASRNYTYTVDPPIENPTEFWTYSDVNELYILEPKQRRVVVVSKSGALLGQYTSELWVEPSGLAVDPAESIIYILDNNNIYSFSIN